MKVKKIKSDYSVRDEDVILITTSKRIEIDLPPEDGKRIVIKKLSDSKAPVIVRSSAPIDKNLFGFAMRGPFCCAEFLCIENEWIVLSKYSLEG